MASWRCAGKKRHQDQDPSIGCGGRRFSAEGSISVDQRRENRDLVGVHKSFPAGVAIIRAGRLALDTLCQVRQLLERMLTTWWRILLGPLRLEVSCLSLRHATSSRGSRAHLCRQIGFRQAHIFNCGKVILRPQIVQPTIGSAFWL